MSAGRPSKFTKALGEQICALLADGKSLRKICEAEDMPSKTSVFNWLGTKEEFLDQYKIARECGADSWADDIIDIADDSGEDVPLGRLRVDARKWAASKLKPKKYGDSTKIEHTGSVVTDATLTFVGSKKPEEASEG